MRADLYDTHQQLTTYEIARKGNGSSDLGTAAMVDQVNGESLLPSKSGKTSDILLIIIIRIRPASGHVGDGAHHQ